jgi:U3 small nucleolar RNA-associated protein 14
VRTKSKKRALDAFSIASHQNPDKVKIRQHRLGTSEGGNRTHKRSRDEDEEEEEEAENPKKQRKGPQKGRFDELNLDAGSDSEGNEWRLGQVDSDEDSDLDSDEAFGESDEERFEGFAFSGSSDKKSQKKSSSKLKSVNLDESGEDEDSDSELEEGDLGEDAIDLAAMLDATGEDDKGMVSGNPEPQDFDSESGEEEDDEDESSDDESSNSLADDEEASKPAKLAALQKLIANLPQTDLTKRGLSKQRSDGASEYNKPSEFGLSSKTKLTLEDFGLAANKGPNIKKALKFVDPNEGAKRKGVSKQLEVPLVKRQQDRLDRSAAYDKSKETLDRWTDTVKHNRRADHLMFPLPDNDVSSAKANSRLQPTANANPFNELEATIQSILEESGLANTNGKDEDQIRQFEELETKKMSIEEVKERRDQLRMARELLFREEAKAKRIKKIKSKSYRKVHRKQREKEERLNKEALAEGGFVPSEDELEAQDRRRATERMGQKHRGSKWAKATKETGRAAWDDDARAGISEMARRDEELRKRVEGRAVRKEFEDDSDASFGDSNDDISEDDDVTERRRLLRQLEGVNDTATMEDSVPGSKLANMKFMRNAEASRRKENDAMVEEIRRELAGESSSSEEDRDIGRRMFGPGSNKAQDRRSESNTNEFEEPTGSDNDNDFDELEIHGLDDGPKVATGSSLDKKAKKHTKIPELSLSKHETYSEGGGAWSKVTSKSNSINEAEAKRRRHKSNNAIEVEELDLSKATVIATQPKPKKPKNNTLTLHVSSDEESGDENSVQLPFAIRDQELIKRAFAGQDVVGEFEAEKKQTIADEDEKIIDNTLPGWGSWTGDGVSKREKARNKGRFLTKTEGIKEHNRKDAKLERVIINEKRVKKASTELSSWWALLIP